MKNIHHRSFCLFALILIILVAGCSDDPEGPSISPDTVIINGKPDSFNFQWTLEFPDGLIATGHGDSTLTSMSPGVYSISWEQSPEWYDSPGDQNLRLYSGNSITFSGTYNNDLLRAITPDILMHNFKACHDIMLQNHYAALLHNDFRIEILQGTIDTWESSSNPLTLLFFDYVQTAVIIANIFGGAEGENEVGGVVPPVQSIDFSVLDKESIWEPVEESEEYYGGRGAYKARYHIIIYLELSGVYRFEVDQSVDFYAIQGTDGFWGLLGIKGYSNSQVSPNLATVEATYDGIFSVFR